MKCMLLPFVILLISCSEQNVTPQLTVPNIFLEGKWVEKENRQDTIIFDSKLYSTDRKFFSFRSADEISGYDQLRSTMFEFKIEGDKIRLYNLISSCFCFDEYRFSVKGDKMIIGNFYDLSRSGASETFVRL